MHGDKRLLGTGAPLVNRFCEHGRNAEHVQVGLIFQKLRKASPPESSWQPKGQKYKVVRAVSHLRKRPVGPACLRDLVSLPFQAHAQRVANAGLIVNDEDPQEALRFFRRRHVKSGERVQGTQGCYSPNGSSFWEANGPVVSTGIRPRALNGVLPPSGLPTKSVGDAL